MTRVGEHLTGADRRQLVDVPDHQQGRYGRYRLECRMQQQTIDVSSMTSASQSREFPPSRLSRRMVLAAQWRARSGEGTLVWVTTLFQGRVQVQAALSWLNAASILFLRTRS